MKKYRFLFFPLGIDREIEVLTFLGVQSPVVVYLPPYAHDVINRVFKAEKVIIDDKKLELYIINDKLFNEIFTDDDVFNEIISSAENKNNSLWFIGSQEKLLLMKDFFCKHCAAEEEIYFHNPEKRDTLFFIDKRYQRRDHCIHRFYPVEQEHLFCKN